jgi:hypothetical protein
VIPDILVGDSISTFESDALPRPPDLGSVLGFILVCDTFLGVGSFFLALSAIVDVAAVFDLTGES